MNTLIVYFSKFGNTHRIADTIAASMANNRKVQTIDFDSFPVNDLDNLDLLVMGCPTHKMNLPKAVNTILENVPKNALSNVPVVAFDTSYKMSWLLNQFTASKRLANKLRKLGGKLVVPPEIFLVSGREGPLFDGELDRAQDWATSFLGKINNIGSHQ
jgi:flavodoxin